MISLCLICKNEERWLNDFLTHHKSLASEIIVVDTGSTDSTKQIILANGAKLLESSWEDDFSKPRNVSIQHATQPWILVLDPDEKISERDQQKIKELCLSRPHVKAFAFQTRNYVSSKINATLYECRGDYTEEKGYSHFFLSSKIRLFQNFLGINWKGIVHETVNESVIRVCRPGEFEESTIPIHHYGSDLKIRQDKNKHDLYYRLTAKKILLEPNNPDAFVEFAKERIATGEIKAALSALKTAHELDPSSPFYKQQWEEYSHRYKDLS